MEYSNETVVGVDTAQRVFQLHWVEPDGERVDLTLSRGKISEHFANRAPCRIGLEACAVRRTGRAGSGRWTTRW